MYGYADSSSAASALTPFTGPRHTTDPAGLAAQAGAVGHAASNAATQPTTLLPQLATPAAATSLSALESIALHVPNVTNVAVTTTRAANSGRNITITNMRLFYQATRELEEAGVSANLVSAAPVRLGGPAVSAGMGRAGLVGTLSVPPSWGATAAEVQPTAVTLPTSGPIPAEVSADTQLASGNVFSQSVLGTLSRDGPDAPRHRSKQIIVRSPAAG